MREDCIKIELNEACDYSKGKKPKVLEKEISSNTPIPYINIKAFEKGIVDQYTDGTNCNLCEDGDLLMVWDGARAGFTGKAKKGAIGSTLMKIEPKIGIEKNYLFYYLLSLYKKLNTNPRGVGIPHVEPRLLWNSRFLLPPLPIQRAIVSKIENLFASLDKGIADLKKAQEQLKIYRQAVLKKAFEGNKVINGNTTSELMEGWRRIKLSEACERIKVGVVIKPKQYYSKDNTGVPAFRSANVREFQVNDANWVYFTIEGHKKNKRTQLKEGDVLIVRSGYPGTSCIVPQRFHGANAIDILIATPDKKQINSEFLCAFNNSPLAKGLFSSGSRGVAQKHLNVGIYSNLHIDLPVISEQIIIVKEIESRLSVCDKIEQSIKESLEKSDALRQSILKKAFEGELLSEDEIEECKQEEDYEPAGVLLERIKREKKN